MSPELRDEIRDWLYRAQLDEDSAERLLFGGQPIVETALFHCQQLAEKSLKAYLTFRGMPFGRTHDLVDLVKRCETVDSTFATLLSRADDLSQYAVRFRYPTEQPAPAAADASARLEWARQINAFVLAHLPSIALA